MIFLKSEALCNGRIQVIFNPQFYPRKSQCKPGKIHLYGNGTHLPSDRVFLKNTSYAGYLNHIP